MAQITPVGSGVAQTIPDYLVAAALFNEANNASQNNVLTIGGIQYQFNTLTWGNSSTGTFASATWDVAYNGGTTGWINQWPAGSSIQDASVQGDAYVIQGYFGRNGYTGTATATITDSNGLMNSLPVGANTKNITADISVVMFWGTVKSILLPGTYRLIFNLTDGSTTKIRTIDVVVTAYPSTAPGDGWL